MGSGAVMKLMGRFLAAGTLGLMALGCSGTLLAQQSLAQAEEIEDNGDLILNYTESENSTYEAISQTLQNSGVYDDWIDWLNQSFAFPQDILVSFEECGEANAYYDPNEVKISMCYELFEAYAGIFNSEEATPDEFETEVVNAGLFTFFHELGHALIDQYQLPVTGREEDAVDNFAAMLLIESGEEEAALASIYQFAADAEEEAALEELPYWGEHSLSMQRSYTVTCLIYGSNPDYYADWVSDDWLPQERAERCEAEYEQVSSSWNLLLEPFMKSGS